LSAFDRESLTIRLEIPNVVCEKKITFTWESLTIWLEIRFFSLPEEPFDRESLTIRLEIPNVFCEKKIAFTWESLAIWLEIRFFSLPKEPFDRESLTIRLEIPNVIYAKKIAFAWESLTIWLEIRFFSLPKEPFDRESLTIGLEIPNVVYIIIIKVKREVVDLFCCLEDTRNLLLECQKFCLRKSLLDRAFLIKVTTFSYVVASYQSVWGEEMSPYYLLIFINLLM